MPLCRLTIQVPEKDSRAQHEGRAGKEVVHVGKTKAAEGGGSKYSMAWLPKGAAGAQSRA